MVLVGLLAHKRGCMLEKPHGQQSRLKHRGMSFAQKKRFRMTHLERVSWPRLPEQRPEEPVKEALLFCPGLGLGVSWFRRRLRRDVWGAGPG